MSGRKGTSPSKLMEETLDTKQDHVGSTDLTSFIYSSIVYHCISCPEIQYTALITCYRQCIGAMLSRQGIKGVRLGQLR